MFSYYSKLQWTRYGPLFLQAPYDVVLCSCRYHPDLSVKWVLLVQHFASVAFVVDYVLRVYR